MSSWSDRPEATSELQQAVAARDHVAISSLLAEKHGEQYAADVLAALRLDVEAAAGA